MSIAECRLQDNDAVRVVSSLVKYRGEDRKRETITSLGIDVGTTTTCLILSRITTARLGGVHALPRVEIVDRQVIYRSPIRFTPLVGQERLDGATLLSWLDAELAKSGVRWEDIGSGAVIITGESAQRENAREIVQLLADHAGRFVVATAGPALEAMLAGRGAGAATRSKQSQAAVLNLDVGGGTTNGAVFRFGEVVATVCAHVGGQLVCIDPGSEIITRVSPPARALSAELGLTLREGQPANLSQLWALCQGMAEGLDGLLSGGEPRGSGRILLIGAPVPEAISADAVSFSGGVAHELYATSRRPRTIAEVVRYGDMGPLLAAALRESNIVRRYRLERPAETIYATVIGAGMEVMELSGSTIYLGGEGVLPLRNLPMARPPGITGAEEPDRLIRAVREAVGWFTLPGNAPDQPVALTLSGIKNPRYSQVVELARALSTGLAPLVRLGLPVVVVLAENIGKVLGNALAGNLPGDHPVVCIDQIRIQNGDYIDIGEPLYGGSVVPVVVKTLVFGT